MLQDRFSYAGLVAWLERGRRWLIHNRWFNRIARWGYLAKGFMYIVVGLLAVQAAFGAAHNGLGLKHALARLSTRPFGPTLLVVVGVGLMCYVVWCFSRALTDIDQHGSDLKGLILRARYVISGYIFARLVWESVELIVDWSSSESDITDDWTRALFAWPPGRWLIAAVGIVVLIAAVYQFRIAWGARFLKSLDLAEASEELQTWITTLGRIGYTARGIVYGIMGGFLAFSVYRYTVEQIDDGIGDALIWLAQQSVGPWLLASVAVGLMCYGIYLLAEARFRTIRPRLIFEIQPNRIQPT